MRVESKDKRRPAIVKRRFLNFLLGHAASYTGWYAGAFSLAVCFMTAIRSGSW
jgi:hypothetical protein